MHTRGRASARQEAAIPQHTLSSTYPNRDRALRHIKRAQAVYLYGRFPQRYALGMPAR